MYTFKNQCQEDSSLYLNDETTAIVLNTNGTIGEINEQLRGALRYMAGAAPAGEYAESLDKAVKDIKLNEKWRRDYMAYALKLQERDEIADFKRIITTVRNGKGKGSDDFLISILGLDRTKFDEISNMIDTNPDKSDWDIANIMLLG